ncbi:MAG: hypothetical protein IIW38_04635, partial [Alistipes sp.]|nr:hypothetical protein [Alistipes sp.]
VPSTNGAIAKSFMSLNTLLVAGILILQLVVNNWDKIAAIWRDKTPEELATEAIEKMNEALERQQEILTEQNTENLRKYTEALREVGGSADKAREALEKFNEANRQNELAAATKKLEEAYKAEEQAYKAYVAAASGSRLFGVNEEEVDAALEVLNEARAAVTDAKNEIAQAENAIAKAESDRAIQATENAQKAAEEHQKEIARLEELKAKMYETATAIEQMQADFARGMFNDDLMPLPDFEEGLDEYEEYFDKVVEANNRFFRRQRKITEAEEKAKKALIVDSFAEMLGNTASLFEENTVAHKAFAIAEATISTYSAAAKSFEQLGGWPFGLVGIASSIAAGLAQVKNILAVDTSGKSTNVSMPSAPAIVSAPAVVQEVPLTRTMLDASQELRLNSSIQDQRVYVVYSDIEGAGKRVDIQRDESSF